MTKSTVAHYDKICLSKRENKFLNWTQFVLYCQWRIQMAESIVYLTKSIFNFNYQNSTLTLCISAAHSMFHVYYICISTFSKYFHISLFLTVVHTLVLPFHLFLLPLHICCGLHKQIMRAYAFNWVGLGSCTISCNRDGQGDADFLSM